VSIRPSRYTYGHDRNSNRLYRENAHTSATKKDEGRMAGHSPWKNASVDILHHVPHRLNRLTTWHRGDLNVNKDEIPTGGDRVRGQAWGLSPVGNWDDFETDDNGDGDYTDADDLDQERKHNDVNEIYDDTDAITEQADPAQTAWPDPVWSARGNMTTMPKPADLDSSLTATYDAWNRLIEVKDDGRTPSRSAWKNAGAGILHARRKERHQTVIQKNIYDALGRRVKKHIDTAAPGSPDGIDTYQHMYYNTGWQLLETRETDVEATAPDTLAPQYQFVWSTRYIDAPILRDDFTVYGVMDGRIYYLTDANFNVTALVDEVDVDSWQVVERYMYDPYGAVTVLDGGPADPDNPGGEGDTEWDPDPNGVSDHLNPILYCGYYYDLETGLYHVGRRSYHPYLGRWMQRDPIGHIDGMSLYEYCRTRPGAGTDPSGLLYRDDFVYGSGANRRVVVYYYAGNNRASKYLGSVSFLLKDLNSSYSMRNLLRIARSLETESQATDFIAGTIPGGLDPMIEWRVAGAAAGAFMKEVERDLVAYGRDFKQGVEALGDEFGGSDLQVTWGAIGATGNAVVACCDENNCKHKVYLWKDCEGLFLGASGGAHVLQNINGANCPKAYQGWFLEWTAFIVSGEIGFDTHNSKRVSGFGLGGTFGPQASLMACHYTIAFDFKVGPCR